MINDFRKKLQDNGLVDMGFSDKSFIWSNKRYGLQHVEKSLDIYFYYINWKNHFHDMVTIHLKSWTSDHNLIIIEVIDIDRKLNYKRRIFTMIYYKD